jgi:hypothetical protein
MTVFHSKVTVCEGGLIVSTGDGQVYRIDLTLQDRISLASQLLSHGVVEMRNEAATRALMSGLAAGDAYAGEEEEEGK